MNNIGKWKSLRVKWLIFHEKFQIETWRKTNEDQSQKNPGHDFEIRIIIRSSFQCVNTNIHFRIADYLETEAGPKLSSRSSHFLKLYPNHHFVAEYYAFFAKVEFKTIKGKIGFKKMSISFLDR